MSIEYRNKVGLFQISYCFIAKVKVKTKNISLTAKEANAGFTQEWMPINKAIEILEKEKNTEEYLSKFMNARDLAFLKEIESKKR